MKLYEIPKGSKIIEECSDGSKYFIFNHPDGMYSHCTTENGATVHVSIVAELVKEKDCYKFINQKTNEHR